MSDQGERKAYLLDTNMVDMLFRIEKGMDITGSFSNWDDQQRNEFKTVMNIAYNVFKNNKGVDFYISETVKTELGYYKNKQLKQDRDKFINENFIKNGRVCYLNGGEKRASDILVKNVYINPQTGYEIPYENGKKQKLQASLFDSKKSKGKDGRKDFCDAYIYVESILGRTKEGKKFDGLVTFNNLDFVYNKNHLMNDGTTSPVNLRNAIVETTKIASEDFDVIKLVGKVIAEKISGQTTIPMRPIEMVGQVCLGGKVDYEKGLGKEGKPRSNKMIMQNKNGSFSCLEFNGKEFKIAEVKKCVKNETTRVACVKGYNKNNEFYTNPKEPKLEQKEPEKINSPKVEQEVGEVASPNSDPRVFEKKTFPNAEQNEFNNGALPDAEQGKIENNNLQANNDGEDFYLGN